MTDCAICSRELDSVLTSHCGPRLALGMRLIIDNKRMVHNEVIEGHQRIWLCERCATWFADATRARRKELKK
jgi:hypothetical protein